MSISRTWPRSSTLACIAVLCLVALTACGGGGSGGGGGSSPSTTMQITPSNAAARSFLQAQIVELPEENTFSATLDGEDQTLVYGFVLEAGDLFATDVTVEDGQGQVMVRFYFGQLGEEVLGFELGGGSVGFDAPHDGVYFMAISAVPDSGSALTRNSDSQRNVIKLLAVGKVIARIVRKTGLKSVPEIRKAMKNVLDIATDKRLTAAQKVVEIAMLEDKHEFSIIGEAGKELIAALTTVARPDLAIRSFTVRCPPEGPELTPVQVGDSCRLSVRLANEGGLLLDLADSAGRLYSAPPLIYFYRSNVRENPSIPPPRDMVVRKVEFADWLTATTSILSSIEGFAELQRRVENPLVLLSDLFPSHLPSNEPIDLSVWKNENITLDRDGTYYYGACVDPAYLERGSKDYPWLVPSLMGNNCSEPVELIVEEAPDVEVSITGGASIYEGESMTFTVSLNKSNSREVTVNWELTGADISDYTEIDVGSLTLSPVTSGTLSFSPGDASETITLTTRVDEESEEAETVVISLSNPTEATLGSSTTASGIILDAVEEDPSDSISGDGSADEEDTLQTCKYFGSFHYVAERDVVCKIRQSITLGVDINLRDFYGQTPLHRAASWHAQGAVRVLIDGGADINAKDNRGEAPLHEAASTQSRHSSKGYIEVDTVRALLEGGADVNSRDNSGNTPLHDAVVEANSTGEVDVMGALIEGGADVNAKDNRGEAPLHFASGEWMGRILRILVENGADVNIKDNNGNTPLYDAVFLSGRLNKVNELIGHGADVNAMNNNGNTPLHRAAGNQREDYIRVLLAAGASVGARNNLGNTPCLYARYSKALGSLCPN